MELRGDRCSVTTQQPATCFLFFLLFVRSGSSIVAHVLHPSMYQP